MSHAAEPLGSDLCQSCGVCCDGTLFEWVPLEPTERASAVKLRLNVVDTPEGGRFNLRCSRLEGTVCGIYEARPRICRDYTCKLYARYTQRELSLDEALAIVAELKEARRELRARIALLPHGGATRVADLDPKTMLLRVALKRLIARRFQEPEESMTERRAAE